MESKKINQLATELAPELSDLTIIGDPTTGISKKITLSQMASLFTGTVEEYASLSAFPLVGAADTIYIALDTNIIYRWNTSTSAYVELSPNIVTSLVFNDANGFDGTISLVGSTATLTITTALTTGSVGFIGASGALTQDNSNFFWDNSNKRLGINTNAPTTALDVFGSGIIGRVNGTSTNNAFLGFASAGSNKWSIGNVQSDHRFRIYSEATTSELVSVLSTGEFGIGIANPTTKLHIDGGTSALIANLDADTSIAKSISFRTNNSARINLEVSGTESGSNAGMDFFIRRYSDAGALIDTPLTITRSTGAATFSSTTSATAFIPTGSSVPTNGMYLSATNTLNFATNSTNRITINSAGNVGIGNTNPFVGATSLTGLAISDRGGLFKLAINDVMYLSNNLYYDGANWKRITANGGTFMQLEAVDGGTLRVFAVATGTSGSNATTLDRFMINSTGQVGIGTGSPETYAGWGGLDVRGGNGGHVIVGNTSGTNRGEILTDSNGFNISAYTNNNIAFKTNNTFRAFITNNGLKIDNGELNAPKYVSFEGNSNGGSGNTLGDIRWYNYQWDTAIRAQIKGEHDSGLSNGRLSFWTGGGGVTERARIGTIGNLANIIGASDADSKTYMNQINNTCGLVPVPSGSTLYLYSRSGSTNYRALLTSSTYFTGQHGNKPIDMDLKTNIENYIGMIVSSVGSYYSVNPITNEVTTGIDAIQISEALPEIKLTDKDEDKAVWGVVTNVKNDNYNTDGSTEYDNDPQFGDRLGENVIRVNGLGEGAIWVTNINGNIENGDYICSSIIAGYGKKQSDDLLHNYTVAKSTMDCDFDLNNQDLYKCEEFTYNGKTYKKAFIGCTYHCS